MIIENSAYDIVIEGQGNFGPSFTIPARLVVVPTIDDGTQRNGVNPVDVGIFTNPSPLVGATGALWFGTNTSLSSLVHSTLGASAIDIAFVEVNRTTNTVSIRVDGNIFGLPAARLNTFNIYNLTGGILAQVHNILAGTMEITFTGSQVQGTINLGGSSGFTGPAVTSSYAGVFTGSRID